ncbi:trypsin-like peptidase domain-containing protein [Cupriavidus necator]
MKTVRSLLVYAVIAMATACAQGGIERQSVVPAPDLTQAIGKSGRAVVSISATVDGASYLAEAVSGQALGDIRIGWHQRANVGMYSPSDGSPRVVGNLGSGFIISADGLILTSAHVIGGARFVRVKLPDRRDFDANVVGSDLRSDIAVLRIHGTKLPVVAIGDSSKLRAGSWVVAIGSPYGFENSASFGIVSSIRRTLSGDAAPMPLIQSDVALNPGSSGGPLLNSSGEVIGINNHIFTLTGGFQGLSFAIPINPAMRIAGELIASGQVMRGRLGVGVQDVDRDLAQAFGLPVVAGALVGFVEPGGPAAQAGVKVGDVVTRVGNVHIEDTMTLAMAINDLPPSRMIGLRLIRRGVQHAVTVVIGALPTLAYPAKFIEPDTGVAKRPDLMVRGLAESEAYAIGIEGGVLVEQARGAARRAGILPGDVILAVNDIAVASAPQLHSAMAAMSGKAALLVLRGDVRAFIPIDTS